MDTLKHQTPKIVVEVLEGNLIFVTHCVFWFHGVWWNAGIFWEAEPCFGLAGRTILASYPTS